jgi:hypothetical protein
VGNHDSDGGDDGIDQSINLVPVLRRGGAVGIHGTAALHGPAQHLGVAIRVWVLGTRRVLDPMGLGTGTIFYPWVVPVPDLKLHGYSAGNFSAHG